MFVLTVLFVAGCIFPVAVNAQTISSITIDPALDISFFGSYTISSVIADYATTSPVTLGLLGLNGDGGPCWQYYADGTCASSAFSFSMTYDSGTTWKKTTVRPDTIYPQIYFAPSSVTLNNTPSEISIRRNNYHVFHFENPFTMADDMSFWIEINSEAASLVNSADLLVYVVESGTLASFFDSDWRNSPSVELVAAVNRATENDHTHTTNSGHYLITLATNPDGTIGDTNINVSDDFWVILYANSPNTARGWNLMYHNESLCTNTNGWYTGNQIGWTTATQTGCPDVHVHAARRTTNADGVRATVTAGAVSETQDFSFAVLPNLPPNQSTFLTPVASSTYAGDIHITWATTTDANGDTLTYDVFLLDDVGNEILPALAASTTDTFFVLDSTGRSDGQYGLKGYVHDGVNSGVEFSLAGEFTIDNTDPIQTLSAITLSSSNASTTLAKAGDTVTLSFTASGAITTPTVFVYSGGEDVTDAVTVTNTVGNDWTATYEVSAEDAEGMVTFDISSVHLDQDYYLTTDGVYVTVDTTAPSSPTASPDAGSYRSEREIELSSDDGTTIRYTLDGSTPNCSVGTLYTAAFIVSSDTIVNSVACDAAGNESGVSSDEYDIGGSSTVSYSPRKTTRPQSALQSNNQLTPAFVQQFSRNLSLGTTGPDVLLLQKFLNNNGFLLAQNGPGSPGNETDFFGRLTRAAVIRFQQAKGITPAVGFFGPITRGVVFGLQKIGE